MLRQKSGGTSLLMKYYNRLEITLQPCIKLNLHIYIYIYIYIYIEPGNLLIVGEMLKLCYSDSCSLRCP